MRGWSSASPGSGAHPACPSSSSGTSGATCRSGSRASREPREAKEKHYVSDRESQVQKVRGPLANARPLVVSRVQDAGAGPSETDQRNVLVAFSGLLLGMLLGALDQTIVATALPTVVGELGGMGHLSWVVTAYLLASTASIPLWGKLGDLYGRKALFQATLLVFLVGSALCGTAESIGELIGFRAFQGLGAGGLFTLAMAIVGDLVSPRERGRYQGYIQAMFALASVAGPLIGGSIVDHLNWRWIFYVNLPVGVLALAVVGVALHVPAQPRRHAVDY